MGDAYMYLEIDGLNCIDETQPYNESKFNATTNKTNGKRNINAIAPNPSGGTYKNSKTQVK